VENFLLIVEIALLTDMVKQTLVMSAVALIGSFVCIHKRQQEVYSQQCFFVKEYFPVPSSGGNQCKNRHAPIWHFG